MPRIRLSCGAGRGRLTFKRCTAGLVLSATLLSSTGALADARTEAKSHFKKGMASIAAGQYEDGISELQRAYEILPHPNVLYNIARAYAESGELEGALATFRKYLDGNPGDKDEVTLIVTALEARIQRQRAISAAASQPASRSAPGTTVETATPGTTPGAATAGAGAVAAATSPVDESGAPTGPSVSVGQAKSEDVFEESVVTASKGAQSPLDAPNSTSIITEQDIRLSGLVQIPDLLRRLAGVDVMETTNSQSEVSLRGFNQSLSNKILVLINGRSTFVDLLGATIWATLPIGVEDIERIEVVRGPGSALYGANAFNGVVNIITKAPGAGKSGLSVVYGDHNTAHGSMFATGREQEMAYRFTAGFDNYPRWVSAIGSSRVDALTAPTNFGGERSSQKSVRMNAEVTREMGSGVTAGVGVGYVRATTEIGAYAPLGDNLLELASVDATAFVTSKHFEVHAFYDTYRGQNSVDANYIGQSLLPAEYNLNVADAEAQYINDAHSVIFDNSLHLGLGYRYKSAVWGYMGGGPVVENWESAYVHDELGVGKQMGTRRQFAFVADVRGDYVPYLSKIVPSPKGSILFHPSNRSTIRGIMATAFRIPTFLESHLDMPIQLPATGGSLQFESSNASIGSPRLKAEQVVTEEVGYLNTDSDYFTFDSAVFHNNVRNLIELAPNRAITPGDLATGNPAANFNATTSLYPLFYGGYQNQCQTYDVYGGEWGVRTYPAEGLDLYANYTLMDVKLDTRQCSAAQLTNVIPDARTSAHKVNAGVQVRTKAGFDGSLDFNYVSPQDWAIQVTNVQEQRIQYQPFHLDAYALVNARLGYRFLKNMADLGLVVNNVLNNQHREHPLAEPVGQRIMGTFSYRF